MSSVFMSSVFMSIFRLLSSCLYAFKLHICLTVGLQDKDVTLNWACNQSLGPPSQPAWPRPCPSRSSNSLSGSLNLPHLRPSQPPMSPTAHLEANLGASTPQNPLKTFGFSVFLQCQQLSILGAFWTTLSIQEIPKSSHHLPR